MNWSRGTKKAIFVLCVLFMTGVQAVSGGELVPLRSNYSAVSGAFTPLWLAYDKGLFAKYGLAVDLKYIQPATATQGLLSHSLDIVNPSNEIMATDLTGASFAFMAAVLNRVVFSLYSKPEIRQFSDLRGRVIGVTQPGSTSDFTVRILSQEAGLTPGKDLQVLHLKGIQEVLVALSQGRVDAGVLSAPTTLKARQMGFKELIDITARNIPMLHTVLATRRDFIKEHRDRVRSFVQGYIEGMKISRTDPVQAKQIIAKYTRTDNQDDLNETYNTFVKGWDRVPYVSAAAVQTLLNFAVNPAARKAKPEMFIDNSIVAELEKSGFIDRLYQK